MLLLDQLELGTKILTCQIVVTSTVDDDLDGFSLDARFCMEDVATLVLVLLLLKGQHVGNNESGARIVVAIDL